MKRLIIIITLLGVFLLSACAPKPMYKTSKGKKKQKYYNQLQYNDPRRKGQ
ncbi:MAG TPA: hypothetical protein PKC24_02210 [Cyclobacteriaceae bacterium]|nr:hypothetical protein [Cyclobacteriaceae bacterium]